MDKLINLRKVIDECDKSIACAFAERIKAVIKVAEIKSADGLDVVNSDRENMVIQHVCQYVGVEYEEYIKEIYQLILRQSRNIQNEWINNK